MNKPDTQTVVHLRVDLADHEALSAIAKQETRTILDQYRKAIKDWLQAQS